MPRAMVGPGSAPKRSCSSASSWRGANFSCCATSASARPCASRACASSAPTPVTAASVKLTPLQRLRLLRVGIAPAQLGGEVALGDALTELVLDAQREPQRLRARRQQLVVARDELPRLLEAALAIAD